MARDRGAADSVFLLKREELEGAADRHKPLRPRRHLPHLFPDATPMTASRTGGEILVANLARPGRDARVLRPRRELSSPCSTRSTTCATGCAHRLPAGRRRRVHGRGLRQADRPARHRASSPAGPGASNAAIGIHTAAQDSTPMIVLVGQVGSDFADREAFQEIDYRRMYGSIAKWVAQIDRAERIPEYVAHAYRDRDVAAGPGPVVLALPEDMLAARAECADAPRVEADRRARRRPRSVAGARALLAGAARAAGARRRQPLGRARPAPRCALRRGATRCPVACAFRRQDLFDNRHPHYAGDVGIGINPKLAARVRDADVLLVIGERLGEMTTSGYTLLDAPVPAQALIHVHPGAEELGRVYQPALGDRGDARRVPRGDERAMPPLDAAAWRGERARPRTPNTRRGARRGRCPATLDLWQVVHWLDARLPDDAILTNGAGNYAAWLHRLFRYRALPHAARALLRRDGLRRAGGGRRQGACIPERIVVSWNGDGCFLMNGQELATAVQYGLAVDLRRRRQRHVRHDPHAPGARLSRRASRAPTCVNPGFRRARARLRRAWRDASRATAEFAPAFERALARGQARRCCTSRSIRRR